MSDKNKLDNTNIANVFVDNTLNNISGIFSIKPMAKYLSGARCVIRVNGKIAAFAFQVSWNISTSITKINTIDDYMPYELAPKRIEVSGQISGFRIPGSGPGQELLQADVLSFLHQRYIEIEVRDSQTDNLIFLTRKAMITNRSEDIRAENLANLNLNFEAIGFADERAPSIPADALKPIDVNGSTPISRINDARNRF
jgi:hypothetical protein